MLDEAVRTIHQIREDRLGELLDAATREQITADALDALVDVIARADVPVARYEAVWQAIACRLHRDAAECRRRARQAAEHIDDVKAAIDARERVGR